MTEQRARELLAAEYENSGFYQRAGWVRTSPSITGSDQIAIRAITTALAESLREALKGVAEEAEFLVNRIDEVNWCGTFEDFAREWNGHIDPPLCRLKGLLATLRTAAAS